MKRATLFEKIFSKQLVKDDNDLNSKQSKLRSKQNDEIKQLKDKHYQQLIDLRKRQSLRLSTIKNKHQLQLSELRGKY